MKTPIAEILENHKQRLIDTNQDKTAYWYLKRLTEDLNDQLVNERQQLEKATKDGFYLGTEHLNNR